MSRTGKSSELLYGPLMYGASIVLTTLLYWKNAQAGIVAIILLCAGDGFAGLIGQKYSGSKNRLPHNPSKTWQGSASFIVASLVFSVTYLSLFQGFGYFEFSLVDDLPRLIITILATAVVESLPLREWDNLFVLISGLLLYQIV